MSIYRGPIVEGMKFRWKHIPRVLCTVVAEHSPRIDCFDVAYLEQKRDHIVMEKPDDTDTAAWELFVPRAPLPRLNEAPRYKTGDVVAFRVPGDEGWVFVVVRASKYRLAGRGLTIESEFFAAQGDEWSFHSVLLFSAEAPATTKAPRGFAVVDSGGTKCSNVACRNIGTHKCKSNGLLLCLGCVGDPADGWRRYETFFHLLCFMCGPEASLGPRWQVGGAASPLYCESCAEKAGAFPKNEPKLTPCDCPFGVPCGCGARCPRCGCSGGAHRFDCGPAVDTMRREPPKPAPICDWKCGEYHWAGCQTDAAKAERDAVDAEMAERYGRAGEMECTDELFQPSAVSAIPAIRARGKIERDCPWLVPRWRMENRS